LTCALFFIFLDHGIIYASNCIDCFRLQGCESIPPMLYMPIADCIRPLWALVFMYQSSYNLLYAIIYICNDYFPEMRMSSLCGCVHKLGDVFMVKVSLFDQLW
jgi:hypothetical protein